MHEMALCENIVQILESQATDNGYQRVKTVWLEIGSLAGVEVPALIFSFDIVSRGTLAEGADLQIIERPAQDWCMQCCETVSVKRRFDGCPKCSSQQLQVSGGDELKIKELEVE